jgi:hypothetical protein
MVTAFGSFRIVFASILEGIPDEYYPLCVSTSGIALIALSGWGSIGHVKTFPDRPVQR